MKSKQNKGFRSLLVTTTLIIFVCLSISLLFLFLITILSHKLGLLSTRRSSFFGIVLVLFLISLFIGTIISTLGAKKITMPIRELEKAMSQIAKGNFDIQVSPVKNGELNEFVSNFNLMVRELKSNETLKTDFISNVSHEFKTPLSVIQAYSKSLRRSDLDNDTRKHYEEVLDSNIKKLTNLTSNILSLSKLENQEIVLNKTEFYLDEQIRQSILFLEPEWQKKDIEFDLKLPKTTYYGSQELLDQVWQNLISNAIKFSHTQGKITISIQSNDEHHIISITDNGIGMDDETQKRIFDKFYQGDNSHSSEGNGLGLALVSRILNICDGKISVSSKKDKGSTFIVTLNNKTKSN